MASYKINLEIIEIEKENFHLFVHLKIGEKLCRLLLDTGASKTVFDKTRVLQFVKKKKIKSHESKSVGLGVTEMETQMVKLKNMSIGKLTIKKLEVAVLNISHVNDTYEQINFPKIDGVLGSDFLMKYFAKIDFGKSVLLLKN
jgi:predicted aspartyl protease